MAGLICILLPLLASYGWVRALWPSHVRGSAGWLLQAVLAVGLGFGLSSCVWFVGLVLFDGQLGWPFRVAESAFYLAFAAAGLVFARRRPLKEDAFDDLLPETSAGGWSWLFVGVLGLGAAARLVEFGVYSWLSPHGVGDAWFTWNMRARFLYRGGALWRNAFDNRIGEAVGDYPLLLPLTNARLWNYVGQETTLGPTLVALAFTFGALALLGSALAVLRGRSQASLAGLLLLSTPFYFYLGSAQVADVPLSFFLLATFTLFAMYDSQGEGAERRVLALAGVMAGLAAWTKNEGMLFVLSVVLVRAFVVIWDLGWRACLRELWPCLAGAAPVLGVALFFKLSLAPESNYLVGEQTGQEILQRLADPERYFKVVFFLGWKIFQVGDALPLVLPLYWLLLGTTADERTKNAAGAAALAALVVLGGYAAVYLITPRDLTAQLASSLHRLLMHVWPLTLFAFFLAARTPEEASSP